MELRPEEISNIIKEQITHNQSQIKLTDVGKMCIRDRGKALNGLGAARLPNPIKL